MTADLQRGASVARGTSNADIVNDAQLRIHWDNGGFTRVAGYDAKEVRGRTSSEVLSSGLAAPDALQALSDAAREGKACRIEFLNRCKDAFLGTTR